MSLPAEALPPAYWGLPPEPAQASRAAEQPSGGTRFASLLDLESEAPNPPASPDLFGDDGFDLGDVIDIVNPLQHIPIVSTIYRAITGDEISTGARLAGGTLFGGPIGLAGAVANAAVDSATGRDIGGNALAMLGIGGEGGAVDGAEAVALATASGSTQTGSDALIGDAAPEAGQVEAALMTAATRSDTALAPGEASVLATAATAQNPSRPFGGVMAGAESALPQAANDTMALSPAAHAALMRLAGNPVSGNVASATSNDAVQTPRATLAEAPTPLTPPAPEPSAATAQARPSSASSLIQAQETASASAATPSAPGAISGTPALKPEEIPAAMMAALEKYEALRRARS